ncbi:MAG: ADOP family duplicated permease [Candidatus Acidiferrales bacterium]
MYSLRAMRKRFAGLFRREARDRELAEELESHIAMHVEDNLRAGMSAEEARRQALLTLGGMEQTKERYRAQRALPWIESFIQDVYYGLRVLRKTPGFAVVAILTLALGIGLNTAIFSIVDSVVLRPLPYKDSARLAVIQSRVALFPTFRLPIAWPTFEEIRKEVPGFEDSAAYKIDQMKLTGQGAPALLEVASVSDGFFEELGTKPQIGRLLAASDLAGETSRGVVISNALWHARFGVDRKMLGKTLVLGEKQYVVVGVAAQKFDFPERADLWIPLSLSTGERQNFTDFNFLFIGKIRSDQKLSTVNAQLHTVADRMKRESPDLRNGYDLSAQLLFESRVGNVRKAFLLLLAATTLLVLIACANVASLLLARGFGRQREMALRAALGASRVRIVRQILIESLLLAFAGGLIGVALAIGGVALFRDIAPPGTPRLSEITVNASLLWFALATSVAAGLIFGLAPARHASSLAPNAALKEGDLAAGGSARQARLTAAIVVIEVSLSFVLLAGATLFIRSFTDLVSVDTGMRTDHLLTFALPQGAMGPNISSTQRRAAIIGQTERLKQFLDEVKALPGIQDVAVSDHQVLNGTMWMRGGLEIEGALPPPKGEQRVAYSRAVSATYFQSLGIPLIRGRAFTDGDAVGRQLVAIVSETMARTYWGTLDVVGKHISVEKDAKGTPEWAEIVGVAADVRDIFLAAHPQSEYYLPLYQLWNNSPEVIVRTAGNPQALSSVISKDIWKSDPTQVTSNVELLSDVISRSVAEPRLRMFLLAIFAGLGLVLALLGIYGVLAYAVSRRTREIGIRVALGARRADVVRMVVGRGLILVIVGIIIGIGAALALFRVVASELFEVKATDPLTFVAASALMIFTAVLASYIPARKAMRIDPMQALRHE